MSQTLNTTDFLKTVINTAEHYGFREYTEVAKRSECKECTETKKISLPVRDRKKDGFHGVISKAVVDFHDHKLFALEKPVFTYSIEALPKTEDIAITFNIFNVPKSIGESLLIQTYKTLLSDLGYDSYHIKINSLGDADSLQRYTRELTNFLRKRIDFLPPTARELFKDHAFHALRHLVETDHELSYKTPHPLESLSDTSRKHFRDIIEFLDNSDIPYEIETKLLAHHECFSDVIFSLELEVEPYSEDETILTIFGGRCDTFSKKHLNKDLTHVSGIITLNRQLPKRLPRRNVVQPRVHLVHLGFAPKMHSLLLLETLKESGIAVYQSLASDSLSEQIREAEENNSDYILIMGQKEYVEQSIIVRDMRAKNQEVISQHKLPNFMKQALKK